MRFSVFPYRYSHTVKWKNVKVIENTDNRLKIRLRRCGSKSSKKNEKKNSTTSHITVQVPDHLVVFGILRGSSQRFTPAVLGQSAKMRYCCSTLCLCVWALLNVLKIDAIRGSARRADRRFQPQRTKSSMVDGHEEPIGKSRRLRVEKKNNTRVEREDERIRAVARIVCGASARTDVDETKSRA